jgi:hypothetical protein
VKKNIMITLYTYHDYDNKTAFLEPSVKQYGSSMVMTNVTKPRRTKFINIDTRFQNNGSNKSHNHIINFPERLMEVNKISVSQIERHGDIFLDLNIF